MHISHRFLLFISLLVSSVHANPDEPKRVETDKSIPILSMTDLPALGPSIPSGIDFLESRAKATSIGAKGAVLSFGWSALEDNSGNYTFDQLREAIEWNDGRTILLGIQFINMSNREMPRDLASLPLDDPRIIERFKALLDALAPMLQKQVAYLSLGNEIDWYLGIHPNEGEPTAQLITLVSEHARSLMPNLLCGTTLTSGATRMTNYQDLVRGSDVHFINYYGGIDGSDFQLHDPDQIFNDLEQLMTHLDTRPIVFQEIGYPASKQLDSSEFDQRDFVIEFLRFWKAHQDRIPFGNWFLLYDFPVPFAQEQARLLGIDRGHKEFIGFLTSLGLHHLDGRPRPAWGALKDNWWVK